MRVPYIIIVAFTVLLSACVTNIKASSTQNPPPSEPFKSFGQFELHHVTVNPAFAKHGANQKAATKIDNRLQLILGAQLLRWDTGEGRMLEIEPDIEQIKFIGGGARFWAGAMAGSSAVVMRVNYKDSETGETIASPTFYQHAGAYAGGWSIGGTDNAMLDRIADIVNNYTLQNYVSAVGGTTGAPADRVAKQQ